jgi:hypothetical protein
MGYRCFSKCIIKDVTKEKYHACTLFTLIGVIFNALCFKTCFTDIEKKERRIVGNEANIYDKFRDNPRLQSSMGVLVFRMCLSEHVF